MKWVINIEWFKKFSITIGREQESIKNLWNKYVGKNFYSIFMSRIDELVFFKHKLFWILSKVRVKNT